MCEGAFDTEAGASCVPFSNPFQIISFKSQIKIIEVFCGQAESLHYSGLTGATKYQSLLAIALVRFSSLPKVINGIKARSCASVFRGGGCQMKAIVIAYKNY